MTKKRKVETINLTDPNLDPRHRDDFTNLVKAEVTTLDELIGRWYRHAGECRSEGCDCGGEALAERAEIMCCHLLFIKRTWGEVIIDQHPSFAKFTKECGGDEVYDKLSSRPVN
jgi:hypothetical protein